MKEIHTDDKNKAIYWGGEFCSLFFTFILIKNNIEFCSKAKCNQQKSREHPTFLFDKMEQSLSLNHRHIPWAWLKEAKLTWQDQAEASAISQLSLN